MRFIARTNGRTAQGEFESCAQHLMMTGALCGAFAQSFGMLSDGVITGLSHDLGKYSQPFQQMIRGKNIHVDHSTSGAQLLDINKLYLAAYAVMSHHSGLPDFGTSADNAAAPTFLGRLKRNAQTCPSVPSLDSKSSKFYGEQSSSQLSEEQNEERRFLLDNDRFEAMLADRMLFSCLVDADRLDAEYFTVGDGSVTGNANPRPEWPGINHLTQSVRSYLEERDFLNAGDVSKAKEFAMDFAQWNALQDEQSLRHLAHVQDVYNKNLLSSTPVSAINRKRDLLLQTALDRAGHESGLFTLTAPTGSGKTNVSLSFALRHAVLHHKNRIIYVIPYMSIIDQTVHVFEKRFPHQAILPHYSEASFRLKESDELTDLDV